MGFEPTTPTMPPIERVGDSAVVAWSPRRDPGALFVESLLQEEKVPRDPRIYNAAFYSVLDDSKSLDYDMGHDMMRAASGIFLAGIVGERQWPRS